ncbi:MAG TPA: aminoglycoside phosphotransferase family protein [Nevskiaceae bacterium]|nr:aminoglycoside phosphotransferase family protein [Nevskiaceae bacterium]
MVEPAYQDIARIPELMGRYPAFRGGSVEPEDGGWANRLLYTEDADRRLVVKVPRDTGGYTYAKAAAQYEAQMVSEANDGPCPPLEIPKLIDCRGGSWLDPSYAVYSYVEGKALTSVEIQNFSDPELFAFGQKVGEFIFWLSGTIPLITCQNIIADIRPKVHRREDMLIEQKGWWEEVIAKGYPTVARLGATVMGQYLKRKKTDQLRPNLTGHNDLRPGNILFEEYDEQQRARGIIDFGNTQPSTPENEMRHLELIGDEAVEGAVTAYEKLANRPIDRSLLRFHGLMQLSVMATYQAKYGDNALHDIRQTRGWLERLCPNEDWSELEAA